MAQGLSLVQVSIDFSTFPPCKRVLFLLIKRVNFQVAIWKRTHEHNPEIPSPLDHGFHLNSENGKLCGLKVMSSLKPSLMSCLKRGQTRLAYTHINEMRKEEDEYDD